MRYEVLDYATIRMEGDMDTWSGMVVDIGLGGVQLRTKVAPEMNRSVQILVGRADGNPILLRGEVRRVEAMDGTDLWSTGIKFAPETHQERIEIAEFVHGVFQRQKEQLLR